MQQLRNGRRIFKGEKNILKIVKKVWKNCRTRDCRLTTNYRVLESKTEIINGERQKELEKLLLLELCLRFRKIPKEHGEDIRKNIVKSLPGFLELGGRLTISGLDVDLLWAQRDFKLMSPPSASAWSFPSSDYLSSSSEKVYKDIYCNVP